MQRTATVIALAIVALVAANASAQTNDHFARQRREAVARQAASQHHHHNAHGANAHGLGQWGGPTTTNRYYPSNRGHLQQQSIQFYPVNPYGYGIPSYGYFGGASPYYGTPYYGGPYYGVPSGSGIYIHREIYHSR